jgi:2Fe-2S ferredoxin
LLEVAHAHNVDLEGSCEGSLACSTCHVIIDEAWFDKLDEPEEDEEDMLDLAFGLTRTSRLGCQIKVTDKIDGLKVKLPPSGK